MYIAINGLWMMDGSIWLAREDQQFRIEGDGDAIYAAELVDDAGNSQPIDPQDIRGIGFFLDDAT